MDKSDKKKIKKRKRKKGKEKRKRKNFPVHNGTIKYLINIYAQIKVYPSLRDYRRISM